MCVCVRAFVVCVCVCQTGRERYTTDAAGVVYLKFVVCANTANGTVVDPWLCNYMRVRNSQKTPLTGGVRGPGVRAAAAAGAAAGDPPALENELGTTYFLFRGLKEHKKLGCSVKSRGRETILSSKNDMLNFEKKLHGFLKESCRRCVFHGF